MDDKSIKNFMFVMIFMTVIVGAILFAYCEFGGNIEMRKEIIISLLIGVGGFFVAACLTIFSNEEKLNITEYSIESASENSTNKKITISKTGGSIFKNAEKLNSVTTVVIDSDFVELPEEFLKNIKEKNIKIEMK